MASLIEIETGRSGYRTLIDHVLANGYKRSPRGIPTIDAGWSTIVVRTPYEIMPLGVGRKLNPAIAAAEALQLIGGFSDPGLMFRIAPQFMKYAEPDTLRFHGAYGERIGQQLVHVVRKLQHDPDTRQAVITLWNPDRDNVTPAPRDVPCTVSLHLELNPRGQLELNVTMRSSDLWRGIPYDLMQFSQLQCTVATVLNVPVGVYRHTSWSLHLYESDIPDAEQVQAVEPNTYHTYQPCIGLARPGESIEDAMLRARMLTYVDPVYSNDDDYSSYLVGRSSDDWYRKWITRFASSENRTI